jgi:hypothetical protein
MFDGHYISCYNIAIDGPSIDSLGSFSLDREKDIVLVTTN